MLKRLAAAALVAGMVDGAEYVLHFTLIHQWPVFPANMLYGALAGVAACYAWAEGDE